MLANKLKWNICILTAALIIPCTHVFAALTRHILDDIDTSAIVYTGTWKDINSGSAAQPDKARVYGGTWHDTWRLRDYEERKLAEIKFTGVAVSIYCVLWGRRFTSLNFTLDGVYVGTFQNDPSALTGDNNYIYNTSVFSRDNLPNTQHSVVMEIQMLSTALLDYVAYTAEGPDITSVPGASHTTNSTSATNAFSSSASTTFILSEGATQSSDSRSNTTRTIGIAVDVAAAVILIVCLVAFFFFRRRRQLPAQREFEPHYTEETYQAYTTGVEPPLPAYSNTWNGP